MAGSRVRGMCDFRQVLETAGRRRSIHTSSRYGASRRSRTVPRNRAAGSPSRTERALEELTRNSGLDSGDLDRVRSILDAAIGLNPKSAGLQAVRGLLAERRGEGAETVAAAYTAALELDPDEPMGLLGRARGLVDEDANASLAMGRRALEADSVDTERVTELASRLMESGAENQALELCRLVLRRTPHDGLAAQMLATVALAQGDSSDRTLDLAHRAARFALSETSVSVLRDTYAARGEQAQADELTSRLEARKRSIEAGAAAPSGGSEEG
jgi:Tfp pilus assembly protein PilF